MESTFNPVARKDYYCNASDWICNSFLCDEDYDPEDLVTIEKAREENWKILKGTKYVKVIGKWNGEFQTFRGRPELDAICHKYDLYQE